MLKLICPYTIRKDAGYEVFEEHIRFHYKDDLADSLFSLLRNLPHAKNIVVDNIEYCRRLKLTLTTIVWCSGRVQYAEDLQPAPLGERINNLKPFIKALEFTKEHIDKALQDESSLLFQEIVLAQLGGFDSHDMAITFLESFLPLLGTFIDTLSEHLDALEGQKSDRYRTPQNMPGHLMLAHTYDLYSTITYLPPCFITYPNGKVEGDFLELYHELLAMEGLEKISSLSDTTIRDKFQKSQLRTTYTTLYYIMREFYQKGSCLGLSPYYIELLPPHESDGTQAEPLTLSKQAMGF